MNAKIAATAAALLWIAPALFPADLPIKTAVVYDGAAFDDLAGGLRHGTTYLGALRLQFTFERRGLTVFAEGLNIHGGQPSAFAGDAQGVSNLEAPAGWQLYEAWFQQNLLDSRVSALVGRYDVNSEFYRLQSASLFVNSSFGVGPEFSQSGRGGPSIFPDTSVGDSDGPNPGSVQSSAVDQQRPCERSGRG